MCGAGPLAARGCRRVQVVARHPAREPHARQRRAPRRRRPPAPATAALLGHDHWSSSGQSHRGDLAAAWLRLGQDRAARPSHRTTEHQAAAPNLVLAPAMSWRRRLRRHMTSPIGRNPTCLRPPHSPARWVTSAPAWTARWCSPVTSALMRPGGPGTSPSTSGQPRLSSPSQQPRWRPSLVTRDGQERAGALGRPADVPQLRRNPTPRAAVLERAGLPAATPDQGERRRR